MNTSLPLFSFSIRFDAKSAHLAVGNCVRLDGLKVFLLFAYLGCIYQICSRFSRIKMINIGNNVDVDLSHLKVAAPNVTWLSGGSEVSVLLTDIILPRNKLITNMSVIPSDNSRQQKCNIDDEALVEQVEGIVKESPGRMTIVRCAERFGVSARYLRYKLEDRGITFREIKAKVLHEQANLYLFHSKLSVSDISFKLGFANHASFSRAYKAVTGVAPGENRRNFLVELDNA